MARRTPINHDAPKKSVPADSSKKIYVLEGKSVKYSANHFDQLPKSLLKTLETKELSMQAVCLWLLISELAGDDREAYAGQEYLANRLATSIPSIKRWTKELEEAGWLVKHNRTATSNKYFPAIPAEFADDLDPAYKKTARLTTVDQELGKNKRSTKAHKLTGDPIEEPVEITGDPSISSLVIPHKLMDEPMDKLTGDPLKRQSIKETELEINRTIKGFVVQSSRDSEIDLSSGETECASGAIELSSSVSSSGRVVRGSAAISSPVVLVDVVTADAAPTDKKELTVSQGTIVTPANVLSLPDDALVDLTPDFIRTLPWNTQTLVARRKTAILKNRKEAARLAALEDNKRFMAEQALLEESD